MKLTYLGTGSMMPTKKRNHQAIFLQYGEHGILFDCGEGTQRQFQYADLKATKTTIICLSHWHGDHVLGLPGLLDTLGTNEYANTIKIYGPKGTAKHYKAMREAFPSQQLVQVAIEEVENEQIFEDEYFTLEAYSLKHGIPCVGYRFLEKDRRRIDMEKAAAFGLKQGPIMGKLQKGEDVEIDGKTIPASEVTYVVKGKIIGIIPDTAPCPGTNMLAKDADYLISEATFTEELSDKAAESKHLTAKKAAEIAARNNVKQLCLTHFSARYSNVKALREEAKAVFQNTTTAKDLQVVEL